jgi:2-oxo-3-hexenedioate decarboxylase
MSVALDAIARDLQRAYTTSVQTEPPSSRDEAFDVRAGYAVLERMHAWRLGQGWRPVGRKIGFTNVTIWERYGVDRPMWSHVWDTTVCRADDGDASLSLSGLMEPRIEPEVVFGLASALPGGDDPDRLLDAIGWIAPGFEIVHSPFPGWRFGAADCAAACGLHGRLAVGTPLAVGPHNRARLAAALPTFGLTLSGGVAQVETGRGSNVLGSPLRALMHLRDLLATQPQFPALAAGEIVTTGTLTDAWPCRPGETWHADYGELGLPPGRVTLEG